MGAARVGVGKKIAPIARNPSRAFWLIPLRIQRCLMGLRVVRSLSSSDNLALHPSLYVFIALTDLASGVLGIGTHPSISRH
jgi:hypothetical protein